MSNVENFRPRSGYLLAFTAYFAISSFSYVNILDYGFQGGLPSIAWGLWLCALLYLIFIHPKIIFSDEGVVIINPMKKITIGWQEISEIDARFTMYVDHLPTGVRYHAFAAQAPGRYHSRNIHPNEVKGLRIGDSGMIRAGESPRSNSGAATAIARSRHENFRKSGHLTGLNFAIAINKSGLLIITALLTLALVIQFFHA